MCTLQEDCKLGFMNPFLYWAAERHPDAFKDVTVGSNRYSEANAQDCGLGFNAAPGWDAVSGVTWYWLAWLAGCLPPPITAQPLVLTPPCVGDWCR